jgi:hypothetical protein
MGFAGGFRWRVSTREMRVQYQLRQAEREAERAKGK